MSGGDMNTMKKCSTCASLYSGDVCPKCMAGFAQSPTNPTVAAQEDLPLQPGQTFHAMEILELLGRGGMGVVYKARQPALDRLVALKILPKKMALDPDFQSRFIREAKALGSLNHPNIVAVYDFGAEAGLFFFAMEFVDGTNLRQILRDRKLTADQALKIVPQLCDALEYAHSEGVVHRDIKPENILLDKRGRVKIADFGLAKLTGADSQHHMLTMTNMVMGTPHYMAPEQIENPKSVDHRADIYAMGVVFYEMLTGELPIGRFELPSKKVQIDVRLDEVVLKALEKSPEQRWQKAGDVKDAVTRATTVGSADSYAQTVMTPVPVRKADRRPLVGMGVVTVLALAAAATAWLTRSTTPAPAETPTAAIPAGPMDLSPLHFGPDDRPLGYVLAQTDKDLPRNPFPAKDPAELEVLVRLLDGIGLQNVAPADLVQGYMTLWFRGYAGYAILETPAAERLEKQFLAREQLAQKWTHRKGSLLVMAWVPSIDSRSLFVALVGLAQAKLKLPVEPPPLVFAHLRFGKDDAPSDWTLASAVAEPRLAGTAVEPAPARAHVATFARPDSDPAITVAAFEFERSDAAEAAEKRLRQAGGAALRRLDVYRVDRWVAALAMSADRAHELYARLGSELRNRLGLPGLTFDDAVPGARELPSGYAYARTITDPAAVVKELALERVGPSDCVRAWRSTLTPKGTMTILQFGTSDQARDVERQLDKVGPTHTYGEILLMAEGPDDPTLDDLENLLREKVGWSRNSPRPVRQHHVRLGADDLPKGWSAGPVATADGKALFEVKGPDGLALTCSVLETAHNYGLLREKIRASGAAPGDILLVQNFTFTHVKVPEAAWGAIAPLEAALRKKMRMGPPSIEDVPDGHPKDEKTYLTLWETVTKERPQLRKLTEGTGLEPAEVVAARYASRQPNGVVLFQLREGAAGPGAPSKPGRWVKGANRLVAWLPEETSDLVAEIVRGLLRVPKN